MKNQLFYNISIKISAQMNTQPSFDSFPYFTGLNSQVGMFYPSGYQFPWQFPSLFQTYNFEVVQLSSTQTEFKNQENIQVKIQSPSDPLVVTKSDQKKRQSVQIEKNHNPKTTRNIKANILKDFVRSLKKDATQLLLVKKVWNFDYPIKKFIETLVSGLPSQGKYIRTKSVLELCRNQHDRQFSLLLRIVLRNFLKSEYKNFVILKRKNKVEYLKACREIEQKLTGLHYPQNDQE